VFVPYSSDKQIQRARELMALSLTDLEIAHATGVTRRTISRWRNHGFPSTRTAASGAEAWRPSDDHAYAYLLGAYLGDGCISGNGSTFGLHITLDERYPEIISECRRAIERTLEVRVGEHRRAGYGAVRIYAYSSAWPFVFPQHGPGRKHERKIELHEWQARIVDRHPRAFLRGLIHTDGSRCVNRFSVRLKSGPRQYQYVRYFFTNYSEDIRRLFCTYCSRLGIRWTQSSFKNISVSHRDSVAILDSFIGPKS
jgi:hypothetical protein